MIATLISRLGLGLLLAMLVVPAQAQQPGPEDAVEAFYQVYLRDAGAQPAPERQEAAAYSDYLTADFITWVEALLASFKEAGYGYDPFLCAQNTPTGFSAAGVRVSGDEATVLLSLTFGDNPNTLDLTVTLIEEAGGWKLDAVACGETVTPRGVVEDFYTWYLAYARPDAQAEMRNPLIDGAYHDYPFLTPEWNAHIDSLVAKGLMADPFLCAQDIPGGVRAYELATGEDTAEVLVRAQFDVTPHYVLAQLVRVEDQWLIDRIVCDAGPAAFVQQFYQQYISLRRYDIEQEVQRTPIADWGYGTAEVLSDDLRDALVSTFASAESRHADPVVCAQDLPERVVTEPLTVEEGRAEVQVNGLYPDGPDSYAASALARVTLERDGSLWKLTDISCDVHS